MHAIDELFGPVTPTPPTPEPADTSAPVESVPASGEDEQTPVSDAKPGYVPLQGLLSERDKRKAAEEAARTREAELAALRQEIEALKAPKPEPQHLPDPLADPQGYAAALQERQTQIALNAKLDVSENLARQQHGTKVDEALAWLKQRQGTPEHLAILRQPHPYGAMLEAYERDKALQELGDPRTARERLEAEIRAKIMAEMQQAPLQSTPAATVPQQRAAPPPSLNSVPGTSPQTPKIKGPLESMFGI